MLDPLAGLERSLPVFFNSYFILFTFAPTLYRSPLSTKGALAMPFYLSAVALRKGGSTLNYGATSLRILGSMVMRTKFAVIALTLVAAVSAANAGTEVIRDYSNEQPTYNYNRPLPPPPRPIYYAPPPPIVVYPRPFFFGFGFHHRYYPRRYYWHHH